MNDSTSELGFPWNELDLAATRDTSEIQRAYARRLKTIDVARERDAFLALRRAYEAAMVAAAGEIEPLPEEGEEAKEDLAIEIAKEEPAHQSIPPRRQRYSPQFAPPSAAMPLDWERLDAFLIAFGARGQARDVSGAMSELDSFLRAAPLSIELQGELEARLFGIVMDDPDMPVELLAQLAKHFRWTEIGSGLELNHPALYARFLYRQSSAHEWLQKVRELAGGPLPRWRELMEVFRVGIVLATPSRAARLLLLQYRWYFVLRGPDRYQGETLDNLLREARRFGPLLDGAVDPRMVEFLWRDLERGRTLSTVLDKALGIACAFVALVSGCVAVREPSRDSLTLFAVVLAIVLITKRVRASKRRRRTRQQTALTKGDKSR
jgi:hypothetical protein